MKKVLRTAIAIVLFSSIYVEAQEIGVPLRFDRYYNYDQLVEALKALHAAYPKLTTLDLEEEHLPFLVPGHDETGDSVANYTANDIFEGVIHSFNFELLYFDLYHIRGKFASNIVDSGNQSIHIIRRMTRFFQASYCLVIFSLKIFSLMP